MRKLLRVPTLEIRLAGFQGLTGNVPTRSFCDDALDEQVRERAEAMRVGKSMAASTAVGDDASGVEQDGPKHGDAGAIDLVLKQTSGCLTTKGRCLDTVAI